MFSMVATLMFTLKKEKMQAARAAHRDRPRSGRRGPGLCFDATGGGQSADHPVLRGLIDDPSVARYAAPDRLDRNLGGRDDRPAYMRRSTGCSASALMSSTRAISAGGERGSGPDLRAVGFMYCVPVFFTGTTTPRAGSTADVGGSSPWRTTGSPRQAHHDRARTFTSSRAWQRDTGSDFLVTMMSGRATGEELGTCDLRIDSQRFEVSTA